MTLHASVGRLRDSHAHPAGSLFDEVIEGMPPAKINVLDRVLARTGKSRNDFGQTTRLGKLFRRQGVPNSPEIQRILEIPRRNWDEDPELSPLAEGLTEWLRIFDACAGTLEDGSDCHFCEHVLKPVQAAALQDLHDYRGLIAPIRVGGGKTLVSALAGTVLDIERVLLLIPAKLRIKTERALAILRKHWHVPHQLHILTYQKLAYDSGWAELQGFHPELIVADEAHHLKNLSAICTKRVRDYLKQYPETVYVDLSGTITKRSLLEYRHRQKWALPEALQFLPRQRGEAIEWAMALDEGVPAPKRLAPGALLALCNDEELLQITEEPLKMVRRAYGRRLAETPGVISTRDVPDGEMSIFIEGHHDLPVTKQIEGAFKTLRSRWETPDGHPFTEASELWRHARELICGFFYVWDPRPPNDWLEARRGWTGFVRDIKRRGNQRYYNEAAIAKACKAGQLPGEYYWAWDAVRDSFEPNSKAVWVCDSALEMAAGWLEQEKGICWVEHVAFGQRLAELTGLPYFAAGAVDHLTRKRSIEDCKGPLIASIKACSEGQNLQYNHHRNLIVSVPPGGAIMEQLIGRTHRDGQLKDEVQVDILLGCFEQWDVFRQAQADAEHTQETTRQPQKLCLADTTIATPQEILRLQAQGHPLWAKY